MHHLGSIKLRSLLCTYLRITNRWSHAGNHVPCQTNGLNLRDTKQVILQETKISRNHLTPEIALYLITPECRIFNEPAPSFHSSGAFKNDPFWAFYWPGGQAISRFILDNPLLVNDKAILDVGSGCGASAIAALMHKAKYVVANDIDKVAGCAAKLNAALNGVDLTRLHICTHNFIAQSASASASSPASTQEQIKEDLILLGDVFYDEDFAEILQPWIKHLRALGKQILIGDPGRHGLTADRREDMKLLAKYELTESGCIENNGFRFVNVWTMK